MLASLFEVSAKRPSPWAVRTARSGDWPKGAPDAALFATDPDGLFVATAPDGRVLGRAAAAVREDALLVARLEVEAEARLRGIGRALFEAAAAYGASRRARAIEALAGETPGGVAFLLKAGLAPRTLTLRLAGAPPGDAPGPGLEPVTPGPALAGWVAALDREARGFSRTPEWERAALSGEVLALRRRGRPVAVGALRRAGRTAWIGPVVGTSPDAAARLFLDLAARAGASGAGRIACRVPAESAALLSAARRAGLAAEDARPLLATRRRGDFRRLSGSPGPLF